MQNSAKPKKHAPEPATNLAHWEPKNKNLWKIRGNVAKFVGKSGQDGNEPEQLWWLAHKGLLSKPGLGFWVFKFGEVGVRGAKVGFQFEADSGSREILYFGDIVSGSGSSNFGPAIRSGDELGMLVSLSDDKTKVKLYFYHNGQCLGQAAEFTIGKPSTYKGIQIVLYFLNGKGNVEIHESDTIPREQKRAPNIKYIGLEGAWELKKGSLTENGVHLDETGFENTTMEFTVLNETVYGLDRYIDNVHIKTRVEKTATSWKIVKDPLLPGRSRSTVRQKIWKSGKYYPVIPTKAETERLRKKFGGPLKFTTSDWIHRLSNDPETVILNNTGDVLTLSGAYFEKTGVISFVRYDDYSGPLIVPEIPH